MPFTLIKGKFCGAGFSPEGDSVPFLADQPHLWLKLRGPRVQSPQSPVPLRMEAMDALETHYTRAGGVARQPLELARAARDRLLALTGIEGVVWDEPEGQRLVAAARVDGTPGYVLARATERNARPVCFVYAGETELEDGATVRLENSMVEHSLNYQMLVEGRAYPTFYQGLFYDLRNHLTEAVAAARAKRAGVWSLDRTEIGVEAQTLEALSRSAPVLPKLFRRVARTLLAGGTVAELGESLERRREGVLVLPMRHWTHLANVVEVNGGSVRLRFPPEGLVFAEDAPPC